MLKRSMNKWVVWMLVMVILVGGFFLLNNWEITQYKNGSKPIIIDYIDGEHGVGERFVLKNRDNYIDGLDIGITDFYYVTGINQLSFGLWYKKWKYDDVTRVVDIEMVDGKGNIYPTNLYVVHPSIGVYEVFQSREIRGIDFNSINQLYMKIKLIEAYSNAEEEITINVFEQEKDELKRYD